MFDIINILKFVSLLTYCGFITGAISGLYEISLQFNLCEMFVSLVLLSKVLLLATSQAPD